MTRISLRRVLTAVSFLALLVGGAAAPAVAAVDDAERSAPCWYSACDKRL